jgi:hypothetical protein
MTPNALPYSVQIQQQGIESTAQPDEHFVKTGEVIMKMYSVGSRKKGFTLIELLSRHSHHSNSCGYSVSGLCPRSRKRAPRQLSEQPEADRPRRYAVHTGL